MCFLSGDGPRQVGSWLTSDAIRLRASSQFTVSIELSDVDGAASQRAEMMRVMLYEAAQSMLWSKKWSWLKAWAVQIAKRRGMKKAIVALARRLAVIMHRIAAADRGRSWGTA
jgi:hypothetical protein